MPIAEGPPRRTGRAVAALVALVPALVVAFVAVPPRLAGAGMAGGDLSGPGRIEAAFRTALIDYWRSGDEAGPPAVQRLVDYWFRWHLIKVGISGLLLIVLIALTVVLWRAYLRRGGGAAFVPAGVVLPVLALFALAALIANIASTAAPFASLLPLLAGGDAPGAELTGMLHQAREQLAGSHRSGGYASPALDAMVGEFARYQAALAVTGAVTVLALAGLSAAMWRRFARAGSTDRRARRVLAGFGVCAALAAGLGAVVVVAGVISARDPAPGLLALLTGTG